MATLHERRHFWLSKNVLRLLTARDAWDAWSQYCCSRISPEDSMERCFFQAYNVRTCPPAAERDRAGWQPLLQRSLRRVIFGEENDVYTARLGNSKHNDNKVHCFVVRHHGVTGFVIYTFNEPGRSRRALEALYGGQPSGMRIPIGDLFKHIEVSYVDATAMLCTSFVMALVSRTNREVAELQAIDGNDLHSAQDVHNVKGRRVPAIDDLDAQDDAPGVAPIQRRTLDRSGNKGKHVQYQKSDDETPASEGEESTSSGDDTPAAGCGMGSSTHSFSGETTGAVGASEDADSDNDEDDDYNISYFRARQEVSRINEFGVIRSKGVHGGYEDHTTIRARLVPSEAPRVPRRPPPKKALRVLRNVLGIKQ
ncbi:hypothetical protein PLEOSDRAFT_1082632 [Pleurotus ostreatus PC15]|uniref:Uncharacterized protein n=1 Tax=Pleurotus ostreatus (strain PC15) TaxID=1137138 RepID=A0A067NKW7_PLEO1|nr:hypothetical protein PLEOSDRAFT_1082632 [Pleurotus ostreatus PC15]